MQVPDSTARRDLAPSSGTGPSKTCKQARVPCDTHAGDPDTVAEYSPHLRHKLLVFYARRARGRKARQRFIHRQAAHLDEVRAQYKARAVEACASTPTVDIKLSFPSPT